MNKVPEVPLIRDDRNNNPVPRPWHFHPNAPPRGKTSTIGSRIPVFKRLQKAGSKIPTPSKPPSKEKVDQVRLLLEEVLSLKEKQESQQVQIENLQQQLSEAKEVNSKGDQKKDKKPAPKRSKTKEWGFDANQILVHYFEKKIDKDGIKFYFCKICYEAVGRCFDKTEELKYKWLWTETSRYADRTKRHLRDCHSEVSQQLEQKLVLTEAEHLECFRRCVDELKAGCSTQVKQSGRIVVSFQKQPEIKEDSEVEDLEGVNLVDKSEQSDQEVNAEVAE